MGPVPRVLIACVLLSAQTAVAFGGEQLTLLPFWGPRLEGARFGPANEEFAWVGWIGGTVHLAEQGTWTAYFNPQVETILGHRVRSFEAVQANYSLELTAASSCSSTYDVSAPSPHPPSREAI